MDWVTDQIAVGNIEDAMNYASLREAGVTAILCLNGFPKAARVQGFQWACVELIDGPGNAFHQLEAAVAQLDQLAQNNRVMVHCMEGLSRSVFVVACHLSRSQRIPIVDAIALVKSRRSRAHVDQGLMSLLAERQLAARDVFLSEHHNEALPERV